MMPSSRPCSNCSVLGRGYDGDCTYANPPLDVGGVLAARSKENTNGGYQDSDGSQGECKNVANTIICQQARPVRSSCSRRR